MSVTDRARHGAFIFGAEAFDSGRFAISPAETSAMDPQQLLLLEGGFAALHALKRSEHLHHRLRELASSQRLRTDLVHVTPQRSEREEHPSCP